MRATYPAHLILLDVIILIILAKSSSYEAPYNAIFSNLLLFYPSSVQVFSSETVLKYP
jgi:hypothetical protein